MTSKASPAKKASTLSVRLVQLVALAKLERLALLLTLALLVRLALLVAPRWTLTQQEAASVFGLRGQPHAVTYLIHGASSHTLQKHTFQKDQKRTLQNTPETYTGRASKWKRRQREDLLNVD